MKNFLLILLGRSYTITQAKIVSDTLLRSPHGQVVRIMGDIHMPTDQPHFELLQNFFTKIDNTLHKTTVLIEGGFDTGTHTLRTQEQ